MATYNAGQISRYFEHIGWDKDSQLASGSLEFLEELVKRQLAAVPFGSLALHYSETHLLSLEPGNLFVKLVERNMGGYCMENNTFFAVVLRSLGYKLIQAGARVSNVITGRPGLGYTGWYDYSEYDTTIIC